MTRVRLHILAEGQTEETFVNNVLRSRLESRSIDTDVRCVVTSRKENYEYRGGLNSYDQARRDMLRWMAEEPGEDSRFTTMFDLYRIPEDFPDYQAAAKEGDPYARVKVLESGIRRDLSDTRVMPYVQLHEFEALILTDASELRVQFPDYLEGIAKLVAMAGDFASPELIDDVDGPCRRIIKEIPEYEYRKASAGPIVVARIGLSALRKACAHFGCWISALESLA